MAKNKKNIKFNFNNIDEVADYTKQQLFKANDYVISNSEDVLNASLKRGEKLQRFSQKTVDNSFRAVANQQDKFFDRLDSVKSYLQRKERKVKAAKA